MRFFLIALGFLVVNFGGLAVGSWFTGPGVASDWYQGLDKAPWTPPGWGFGAAWTTVMIGFSWFMYAAWTPPPHNVGLHFKRLKKTSTHAPSCIIFRP